MLAPLNTVVAGHFLTGSILSWALPIGCLLAVTGVWWLLARRRMGR